MAGGSSDGAVRVARLEAQVAALEEALRRRSRELRELQRHLCARDLLILDRIAAGLPALPPVDPLAWQETLDTREADVAELLTELWRSVAPPPPLDDDAGA
jgi:hypothetical protein